MRRPGYRQSPDSDWGFPPFSGVDLLKELRSSVRSLIDHTVWHRVDRWRLERLIRSGTREPLQVSLGCGSVVEPGWIGIDLRRIDGAFRSDLRAPLPFPDGSVSALLAEHI